MELLLVYLARNSHVTIQQAIISRWTYHFAALMPKVQN